LPSAGRRASSWTWRVTAAALIIPCGLAVGSIARGVGAFNSPRGFLNGVPFQMHFLATVLVLAAAGDARLPYPG
jgi:hypothetical protein